MIDRRAFSKLVTMGAMAAVADRLAASERSAALTRAPIKPPRLALGDRVGLVLPASLAFEPSSVDLAREQLEAIGFEVAIGRHATARHGYFAGRDEERAADVNAMFADPTIDGIFCFRGGWGTPRILPLLDYEVIGRNPKVLVGFSDITALLNAIHQETGLVTFHGPAAASNLGPFTLRSLRRVVMASEPIGVLANPGKEEDELVRRRYRVVTLRAGRARGRIVGGNLTLVSTLMGTPWELDTAGAILVLEDTDEELYRIDRMLTQLALGGKLDAITGAVFGFCTDCPPGRGPSLSLEQILDHHLGSLGVPVMVGFAVGHIPKMVTLPIGLEAMIDAGAGTLTIPEAAVSS